MKSFEWVNVKSLADAAALLDGGAVLKAGGVDLVDRMKEGLSAPARVINLAAVRGLAYVRVDKDVLHLGPLATLAGLAAHAEVQRRAQALAQACAHAATPQIRNMATLGGNLVQRPRCWYFRSADFHCRKKGGGTCFAQDGENQYHAVIGNSRCAIVHPSTIATALVALGAEVELLSKRGARTLALADFFAPPEREVTRENQLADDELVAEVRVPLPAGVRSAYWKQGEKESFDWPLAEVAAALTLDGARRCQRASVVLGAAAPVPYRAVRAEAWLQGKVVDEAVATQAAALALDGATPLSKNAYKLPIFRAIVRRTLLAAAGGTP